MIINNLNDSSFTIDGILHFKDSYLIELKKINLTRKLTVKNLELRLLDKQTKELIDNFPINCSDLIIENNAKFLLVIEVNNYFKTFFSKLICGDDYWESTNW